MRSTIHALVLPLLLSPALAAQSVTSPKGYDTIEGNAVQGHFAGDSRFQHIDNTHAGTPLLIKSLGWRRNGSQTQLPTVRTFDLSIDMGRADFTIVRDEFDKNYLPGSRANVFPQTNVSFPDWTPVLPGPTPFDFVVPFATPYSYTGSMALIIDFAHSNNTEFFYYAQADRAFPITTQSVKGVTLGNGCRVVNGALFTHEATAYNLGPGPYPEHAMRLYMTGLNGPANSAVLAFVDIVDSNITGVMCAPLHALPAIVLVLSSAPNGWVPGVSIGWGYDRSLVGANLYTQLFAPDATKSPIPAVVSNAMRTPIPTSNPTNAALAVCYGWSGLISQIGPVFFGGGTVMQWGL